MSQITNQSPRYQVVVRSCHAPSSGGGKYRRPVIVRVVDTSIGSEWHQVRQPVACWRNVDSRYCGPRSAYGQAFAAARELADRLNSSLIGCAA